jgi:hypothetical protein
MGYQSYGEMERKTRRASFLNQCLVLTKRSFVNMYRDLGYYWLRLAIYIALAVGLGTVFYNIGDGDGSVQVEYIFYFILFYSCKLRSLERIEN